MANHPNSVFGATATEITIGSTTRIPAFNSGSDGIKYITPKSNFVVNTTDITATPSIDAVSVDMGIDHLIWAPSGNTHASGTFKSPRMSKITVDLTSGNIVAPGHPIGFYAQSLFTGSGTADLGFGIESKLILSQAGTNVTNFSHFKPAIGNIAGSINTHIAFDADIDFSGITGTVTNKYALWAPRIDTLSVVKGGLELAAKFIVTSSYTLTRNDAENKLMSYGSGAVTITVPDTLPAGFGVTLVQGLSTDTMTFQPSGTNSVFNKDSHIKSGGQFAVCRLDIITSGGSGVGFLSGATSA